MNLVKDLKLQRNYVMPLYLQIAEGIKIRIAHGQIKTDDKLPSINDFSKKYNVSRDTVDRAYKILKRENLVIGVKGLGIFVL